MKFNRKFLAIIVLLIPLVVSLGTIMILSNNIKNSNNQNGYVIQTSETIGPIEINGNSELASHPRVKGNGTWDDPYVIENYAIPGSSSDAGISISNTDKPLIIRNCTIERGGWGINLDHVLNAEINNNNILNTSYGIYTDFSNNNTLTNNTVSNNFGGIRLSYSDNNTLIGNIVIESEVNGIDLGGSGNCTLFNNIMISCGIDVGRGLDNILSNEINKSNSVNGKPIYYFKNQVGLERSDFVDAGQLIFINCTNSNISDMNISDTSFGISLLHSNYNTLANNTASYDHDGIFLYYSHNNSLIENTMLNDFRGIYLDFSDNNTLFGNIVSNSTGIGIRVADSHNNKLFSNNVEWSEWEGIHIDYSNNNVLIGNNASNNRDGIYLFRSDYNTLMDSTILIHRQNGIYTYQSENNKFINNTVSHSEDNGIRLDYSSINNILTANTISHNNESGIFVYSASYNTTIIRNIISYNAYHGIRLEGSINSTILDNIMKSCGIGIYGNLNGLLSLEINESNTVNGKPVYCFKNEVGLGKSDFIDAGQLIFINCSNSEISEMNISDGSVAISLFYSDKTISSLKTIS